MHINLYYFVHLYWRPMAFFGHSFAYVAHFVFFRYDWIRNEGTREPPISLCASLSTCTLYLSLIILWPPPPNPLSLVPHPPFMKAFFWSIIPPYCPYLWTRLHLSLYLLPVLLMRDPLLSLIMDVPLSPSPFPLIKASHWSPVQYPFRPPPPPPPSICLRHSASSNYYLRNSYPIFPVN